MGEEAVRLLVKLIDGTANGPRQIMLPTALIVRQSCRAVRS
jgi:DNA-binding LacI/PurR family transcriptional regulator